MGKADSLFYGVTGITAVEVSQPLLQSADATNVVQIIVQVIIGIATLIGMFKKNQKKFNFTLLKDFLFGLYKLIFIKIFF